MIDFEEVFQKYRKMFEECVATSTPFRPLLALFNEDDEWVADITLRPTLSDEQDRAKALYEALMFVSVKNTPQVLFIYDATVELGTNTTDAFMGFLGNRHGAIGKYYPYMRERTTLTWLPIDEDEGNELLPSMMEDFVLPLVAHFVSNRAVLGPLNGEVLARLLRTKGHAVEMATA